MTRHSFKLPALVATLALWLLSGSAFAQIRMTIGWNPPTDEHPFAVAGNDFKKRVEEYTHGQIQVQTYCCFKMGGEEEMVKKLDPREATILRFRFGLDGGPERTLEEVGEKFNVTRERVRQIQNIALRKLRKMIEKFEQTKR